MRFLKIVAFIFVVGLLNACGGNDDIEAGMGKFNLGVSDNPADAEKVIIAFKQVVLKNETGSISYDVSDNGELKQVDLLAFQGEKVETLVSGQNIALGEYQMCIYIENSKVANAESSYVQTKDGIEAGLVTNSKGHCGGVGAEDLNTGRLFFNKKITIAAGNNNFIAEFDLQKGLQGPKGNKDYWTLKPTAVQLVNVADVGAISGTVSDEIMSACEIASSENPGGGSTFIPAVYLYPADTSLEYMADFHDGAIVAPIASARVNTGMDNNVNSYEFGFVVADKYSLGYTCVAQNDDPESVNTAEDDPAFFIYTAVQNVVVMKGKTTQTSI